MDKSFKFFINNKTQNSENNTQKIILINWNLKKKKYKLINKWWIIPNLLLKIPKRNTKQLKIINIKKYYIANINGILNNFHN